MTNGFHDIAQQESRGAALDNDSTDMDSAQHMSDSEDHTAADHDMEHDGQGLYNGVPENWSIEDVPTDGDMAIDGDYTLWLVIDTNILIEDLEHLKEFHRNVTMGGANGPFKDINFLIVYYIPKKVNSELCAQKERGLKKYEAREANRALYNILIRDKHGVQEPDDVQRKAEEAFPDVLRGPDTNSDDYIRLSGMYLQDQKSKVDGKHSVVLLTGDVNLAIKARASGLNCRKLPGSAGNTIECLPRTRPELLKEFFPQVIVKTEKERRIEALKEKASYDPNLRLLAMHGLGSRRRLQPRSNSGTLSPQAGNSSPKPYAPSQRHSFPDSPQSSRSPHPDPMRAEFPVQSAHHMQSRGSHGSGSPASMEPGLRSQQDPSGQVAHPTAPTEEQSTLKPQGHEILDCVTSGMRLALQWHLQHRFPDVWVQEMEYMSSASAMLDRLLSWPHVLDIFTTIQAEDERQIMQALQQLKLFSSNPEQGDIWMAAESARTVLSSFSRPLSTVSLSVSQPMDADKAFAALKDARKRVNKLYNQLAKNRPQAELSTSSSGAGYMQRPNINTRNSGGTARNERPYHSTSPTAANAQQVRSINQRMGPPNMGDMQSPFLHQQHLQFQRRPGQASPNPADPALLQGLSGLEVSGRTASGQSLHSQFSARSSGRIDSMERSLIHPDNAPDPGISVRGHYSTRAGYQQHPTGLAATGGLPGDACLALLQQREHALGQAALMQASQLQPQLAQHSAPSLVGSLGQQALAQAEWNAAMEGAAIAGLAPPLGAAHMHAGPMCPPAQQQHPSSGSVTSAAMTRNRSSEGMAGGMQVDVQQQHMPTSPPPVATAGIKTAALMQASVELLVAAAQQGQPGDDMAARRLLQALVHARRAALSFPADMHDQGKLTVCLQALQGLWSLLLQMCRQDAVEPDFEDMLMYLSNASCLEAVAKRLVDITNS
ncbi:hypothetical protein COCOBI_01-5180 [Coccomyxa sp. Obi]|nr:hypothetical protein COCOBI_01-5180 [Coccomyxa sp. Obi]